MQRLKIALKLGVLPACKKESDPAGPVGSPRPKWRRWDVTCDALPALGATTKT
jgi:hypothetical protein